MYALAPASPTRRQLCRGLALILPLAGLGGACSEPINPDSMAQQAGLHAHDIIRNAGGGVTYIDDDDSAANKLINSLSDASNGLGGTTMMPLPGPMMQSMAGSPMMQSMAGVPIPSMLSTQEKVDQTADDVRTWLQQRILVMANLESSTDDSATYLLHPDPTCRPLPHADDPPGTIPPVSNGCKNDLEKIQVRVVMRADGDGTRLEILVGTDRLQLSAIIIHSDLLALESDLAKTKAASDYIDQALGKDSPMGGSKLTALTGRVRVSVRKEGERRATFALAFLDPIHVAESNERGEPTSDFTSAKADPVLSVTADGVARTMAVRVGLGVTEVRSPYDPQGTGRGNTDFLISVGGLTGTTTLTDQTRQIKVTGLGVGPTFFEARGQRIFDLNLNPNHMRRFDVVATVPQSGPTRFEITPTFDLSVGLHYAAIAADFKTPPDDFVLDETYRAQLDNGGSAAVVESVKGNNSGFSGGIKVVAGTLTLSSTKNAGVTVPAGKCLTGVSNPPMGAHPILGQLTAADCP